MPFSQYLGLVDMLARMELRADAARFYFGYLWWILEPFLFVAVFYLVFAVILETREPDFLFFLVTGKLAFNWFSKSVVHASTSINRGAGLIGRIDVPKSLVPMSTIQAGLYRQAAVFALLFIILMVGGYMPTANWLWFIPIVLVNYLLILACGYIAACLVSVVRDFVPMISLGMIFLMFTSGIFWNPRSLEDPAKMELLFTFNPIAFLLDCYRQALMYDNVPELGQLAVLAGICLVAIWAMLQVGSPKRLDTRRKERTPTTDMLSGQGTATPGS